MQSKQNAGNKDGQTDPEHGNYLSIDRGMFDEVVINNQYRVHEQSVQQVSNLYLTNIEIHLCWI